MKKKMSVFDATMLAEGVDTGTEAEVLEAWQLLVDTGMAWQLQGWFGRTAESLIEQGLVKRA